MSTEPIKKLPNVQAVLAKLLNGVNDAHIDYVAGLFGLPKMADLPRPGAVRTWDFEDWQKWGAPYGLIELPRTTHSYVLCHPDFKMLRVAMSSSTGDVKSRLNLGSDVRQAFRFEYVRLLNFMTSYIDRMEQVAVEIKLNADATEDELVASAVTYIRENRHTPNYLKFVRDPETRERVEAVEDTMGSPVERAGSLKRLLMKAAETTGQSPRLVVRAVLKHMTNEMNGEPMTAEELEQRAERVYKVLVDGLGVRYSMQSMLVSSFKDIIETHEAIEDEQKRAKLEAREAARAERQKVSKQDAQTLVTDDPAAFAKSMAEIRGSFLKQTGPLLTTMTEAMAKVRELAEHAASFPSPSYPTAKLAELGTANTQLFERASSLEDQLDDLKTAKDAVDAEMKRLKDEHAVAEQMLAEAATHSDWRGAFAELVTTLDAALSSSDFLQLADGVRQARQALTAAKAKIAKP